MDRCYGLTGLPEDIGSLSSLQKLDLSYCKHIEELPESTSKLRSLKELRLRRCENLKLLPEELGSLDFLQILNLFGCTSLRIDPKISERFGKTKTIEPSANLRQAVQISLAARKILRENKSHYAI